VEDGIVGRRLLCGKVAHLRLDAGLKARVDARMKEFRKAGRKRNAGLFSELCFCILTANFNAKRSMMIQDEVGAGFLTLPEKRLAKRLARLGHRFPNSRASYIVEARRHASRLGEIMGSFGSDDEGLREWLVKNVKGLGYKEASHFLRNVGYDDLAIIDFHILDVLAECSLIMKPSTKSLTCRKYLEAEGLLRKAAKEAGMSLAELDLYLWYAETGTVLK